MEYALAAAALFWLILGWCGSVLASEWIRCDLDMKYPQYSPHTDNLDAALWFVGLILGPLAVIATTTLFILDPPTIVKRKKDEEYV